MASQYLFMPNANQWRQERISLAGYAGDVMIRFRAISYSGNNLFIDNVRIDHANGVAEAGGGRGLVVYPNPFDAGAWIRVEEELVDGVLVVYDGAGRAVRRMEGLRGNEVRIEREGLVAGFYTFGLFDGGVSRGVGRFVVE